MYVAPLIGVWEYPKYWVIPETLGLPEILGNTRVGYRKKYRVSGPVRVPVGHCYSETPCTNTKDPRCYMHFWITSNRWTLASVIWIGEAHFVFYNLRHFFGLTKPLFTFPKALRRDPAHLSPCLLQTQTAQTPRIRDSSSSSSCESMKGWKLWKCERAITNGSHVLSAQRIKSSRPEGPKSEVRPRVRSSFLQQQILRLDIFTSKSARLQKNYLSTHQRKFATQ